MPRQEYILSGYRGMWLMAMFDLPVDTPRSRRQYAVFRHALLKDGFSMLQYSIYARYCPSEEAAESHRRRVRAALPPDGYVRVLAITDRQFEKMENYVGQAEAQVEQPPSQLQLF